MVLMRLDLRLCTCVLTSMYLRLACTCELSMTSRYSGLAYTCEVSMILMKLDVYRCTYDLTCLNLASIPVISCIHMAALEALAQERLKQDKEERCANRNRLIPDPNISVQGLQVCAKSFLVQKKVMAFGIAFPHLQEPLAPMVGIQHHMPVCFVSCECNCKCFFMVIS